MSVCMGALLPFRAGTMTQLHSIFTIMSAKAWFALVLVKIKEKRSRTRNQDRQIYGWIFFSTLMKKYYAYTANTTT